MSPGQALRAALFLPCAAGTEALLADECARLLGAAAALQAGRGGVVVEGDAIDAMRLNLHSRLAQRVLWTPKRATQRRGAQSALVPAGCSGAAVTSG